MINKIIEKELNKVSEADLSNFDPSTNTYVIPQKKSIKLEVDCFYFIHLKNTFFKDDSLKVNWNNNTLPIYEYLKIEVLTTLPRMIKVAAIGYDDKIGKDTSYN